jgi:hypothetical protein
VAVADRKERIGNGYAIDGLSMWVRVEARTLEMNTGPTPVFELALVPL